MLVRMLHLPKRCRSCEFYHLQWRASHSQSSYRDKKLRQSPTTNTRPEDEPKQPNSEPNKCHVGDTSSRLSSDILQPNSQRAELGKSSLLERLSLSEVPDSEPHPGVRISRSGQLYITNVKDSQQKHKTALIISHAPYSLEERDFTRILKSGKHIEGWKSGGLEQSMISTHPALP